jgi:hypothetical protein
VTHLTKSQLVVLLKREQAALEFARVELSDAVGRMVRAEVHASELREALATYRATGMADMVVQRDRLAARARVVEEALHRVSLDSQSSMGSRGECGRIARAALAAKEEA